MKFAKIDYKPSLNEQMLFSWTFKFRSNLVGDVHANEWHHETSVKQIQTIEDTTCWMCDLQGYSQSCSRAVLRNGLQRPFCHSYPFMAVYGRFFIHQYFNIWVKWTNLTMADQWKETLHFKNACVKCFVSCCKVYVDFLRCENWCLKSISYFRWVKMNLPFSSFVCFFLKQHSRDGV